MTGSFRFRREFTGDCETSCGEDLGEKSGENLHAALNSDGSEVSIPILQPRQQKAPAAEWARLIPGGTSELSARSKKAAACPGADTREHDRDQARGVGAGWPSPVRTRSATETDGMEMAAVDGRRFFAGCAGLAACWGFVGSVAHPVSDGCACSDSRRGRRLFCSVSRSCTQPLSRSWLTLRDFAQKIADLRTQGRILGKSMLLAKRNIVPRLWVCRVLHGRSAA